MSATVCKSVERLPPLPTIRDIIRVYKLRALKQLSQNFLLDLRVTDKIAKAAGRVRNGEVCEIGPGPGGITRSILAKGPRRLILVEKDQRFAPSLQLLAEATACETDVIISDILNFNFTDKFTHAVGKPWQASPPNIHLIGNLPFNISTPLIIKWLHDISLRRNAWTYGRVKMTLTFQKEVAERIVAPILTPERCRLSVMCQNWCEVNHKFTISGKAFIPPPDVDVGVVQFTPRVQPIFQLEFKMVEKVLRTIFNSRQKYSEKVVEKLFPENLRQELTGELFQIADVDPHTRPFQISNEEYGRICAAYKAICDRNPKLYEYDFRGPRDSREDGYKELHLDS